MDTPDAPRLHGLSTADTHWLLDEAQRVLADLGHPSSVEDGVALRLTDDRTVGLDNLARTLRMLPRKRWRRAVRDQLVTVSGASPDQPVQPADLRVKLLPRHQADDFVLYDALEPFPGVVAVLAAQGDRMSQLFGKLDQVGDRDEAYDIALSNMAALPRPRHTRRRVDPRVPGSWVEFLDGPDAWSAARALVLPDLFRRVLGRDFPATGVLVAVPTKHELWVHVPTDESVLQTALSLSWLSYKTWAEKPYPISPDVFLVSPDMHAVSLVRPDRHGVDVDQQALLGLVSALEAPEPGRAAG